MFVLQTRLLSLSKNNLFYLPKVRDLFGKEVSTSVSVLPAVDTVVRVVLIWKIKRSWRNIKVTYI